MIPLHAASHAFQLERIQHPSLYQQYKIKLLELQKQNNGASNERRLFHGTSSDTIDFILQNGFNRSFCGKNGIGDIYCVNSVTSTLMILCNIASKLYVCIYVFCYSFMR